MTRKWLDQVSVEVLGFVARRLFADRVGMVFTVRDGEGQAAALAGLPDLVLGGLPAEAAGELLAASAGARVDGRVSGQIVAGVAGNPLALVELAGELTAGELSGAVPLGWPLRFGGRLEELYLARVRALPGDSRMLLLVAAADPSGDPALVYEAAGQLGAGAEAGEAAGTDRLIRSAAYYAAPRGARRRAHAALAQATDPAADLDRRAWHLAEAAAGPDEQVAADLERSAGRAQSRGGLAAATFGERAALLTPDPRRRAQQLLAAARAKRYAGELEAALGLLLALDGGTAEARQWFWLTGGRLSYAIAQELWDFTSWHALAARQVQVARDAGALVQLQVALTSLATGHVIAGELAAAARLLDEDRMIAEATGNRPARYAAMMLAAWRSQEQEASEKSKRPLS